MAEQYLVKEENFNREEISSASENEPGSSSTPETEEFCRVEEESTNPNEEDTVFSPDFSDEAYDPTPPLPSSDDSSLTIGGGSGGGSNTVPIV